MKVPNPAPAKIRPNFGRSWISAGFAKKAGFRPEPEPNSGTALINSNNNDVQHLFSISTKFLSLILSYAHDKVSFICQLLRYVHVRQISGYIIQYNLIYNIQNFSMFDTCVMKI